MQAEFVIVSPKQYIYNNIVYTVNPSGFSADIGIMQSNGTEVKAEGSLYDFKTVGVITRYTYELILMQIHLHL